MALYTKIFLFTLSLCVNITSWILVIKSVDKNDQDFVWWIAFVFIMWTQMAMVNYLSSF